jgi:hypothetical protein
MSEEQIKLDRYAKFRKLGQFRCGARTTSPRAALPACQAVAGEQVGLAQAQPANFIPAAGSMWSRVVTGRGRQLSVRRCVGMGKSCCLLPLPP